jgi:translation initiation factor 2 gamma subunit (eIF-2gamma)
MKYPEYVPVSGTVLKEHTEWLKAVNGFLQRIKRIVFAPIKRSDKSTNVYVTQSWIFGKDMTSCVPLLGGAGGGSFVNRFASLTDDFVLR